MNQRVGKYWKATFMSGSNKALFNQAIYISVVLSEPLRERI